MGWKAADEYSSQFLLHPIQSPIHTHHTPTKPYVHRIEKLNAPDAPVVLVNNAGVFETRRCESADGLEMTFAINVAAPFLLTGLLLPTLQKRKRSRIVNVSSISQGAGLLLFFFLCVWGWG